MSVYFIHAEAVLRSGYTAEKIGRLVVANDAVSALEEFWSHSDVAEFSHQGINVVIDKFEKVE